jgi:uncharacterized protein YbjT (DUF2867 family)
MNPLPSGYIGGGVLEKILGLPDVDITALVRNAEKAKKIESFGIKTIVGALNDTNILEEQAMQADVVIEMVSNVVRYVISIV